MKKIMNIIILLFMSAAVFTQIDNNTLKIKNPYKVPPSPEAAAFLKYGEYPVAHNTGIPDISIPLYTIESGSLSLPINLSYHAGGIKVDEIASSVGLGWTLNAGGVITRTIMDIPDKGNFTYPSADDIRKEGYAAIKNGISNKTAAWRLLAQSLEQVAPSDIINKPDKERDTYNYSFNGNYGSFFLADSKIIEYPYSDNKIVNLSPQFYTPDKNGFKIITPDGVTYYFQAVEQTTIHNITSTQSKGFEGNLNFSTFETTPYKAATSWFLTRIESANQLDVIEFNYITDDTRTYHLTESYSISRTTDVRWNGTYNNLQERSVSINESLGITPLLSEIKFTQGSIVLNYSNDRNDSEGRKRLTSINVKNVENKTIKTVIFNNNTYFHKKRLKLQSVRIEGENKSLYDSYDFSYHENYEMPNYITTLFNGVYLQDKKYYSQDLCGYYNGKDNQNLVNQKDEFPRHEFLMKKADLSFSFDHAKTYSLHKIKYAMGGETEFVYDSYSGSTPRAPALRIKELIQKTNQSTIAKKTSYKYSDVYSPIGHMNPMAHTNAYKTDSEYSYTARFGYIPWNDPMGYLSMKSFKANTITTTEYSSPIIPNYMSLYKFIYNKVEENIENKNNSMSLKTIYEYTPLPYIKEELTLLRNKRLTGDMVNQGLKFIPQEWHPETYSNNYLSPDNLSKINIFSYPVDISWATPQLAKKTNYILNGRKYEPLEETSFQYEIFNRNDYVRKGIYVKGLLPNDQGMVGYESVPGDWYKFYSLSYIDDFYYFDLYVSTGWKKLIETTTKMYRENSKTPMITTTKYQYAGLKDATHPHSFVTQEYNEYQNAGYNITNYKYPNDFKSITPYKIMLDAHRVNIVLEENLNENGWTTNTKTEYKEFNINGKISILPSFYRKESIKKMNSQQSDFKQVNVNRYDNFGNPIELINRAGFSTFCIWGYSGEYLIAEIQNATYADIIKIIPDAKLREISAKKIPTDDDTKLLNGLRSIKKASVRTFTYKPLIGIINITESNGITTHYNYDSAGRLSEIVDWKNNPLQKFEYKFRTK